MRRSARLPFLLVLLSFTVAGVRAQEFDLLDLLGGGAGLDERFDVQRVEDLRPEWVSAALHPDYSARLSKRPGTLVLEAPAEVGAVAVTAAPAGTRLIDATFTRWSGTQPVAGLVWGSQSQTSILMLSADGSFALSGCDEQMCWDDAVGQIPVRIAPGGPVRLTLKRMGGNLDGMNAMELSVDGAPAATFWVRPGLGGEARAGVFAGAGTAVEIDRMVVGNLEAPFEAAYPGAFERFGMWVRRGDGGRIETLHLGTSSATDAIMAEWEQASDGWRQRGRYAFGDAALIQNSDGLTLACTRLRADYGVPYETQCFQLVQREAGPGEPTQTCFLDPVGSDGPLGCYAYRTDATGDVLYDAQGRAWMRATPADSP